MRIGIIGGSIAGLECAIRLAGGNEVALFEEHERIGEPLLCAEGWFRVFAEPYGCVDREIKNIIVRYLDIKEMRVKKSCVLKVNGYIVLIDRPAMERKMAEIASEKGCRIFLGKRVKISDLLPEYDLIIDASGHPSQFDREFGSVRKKAMAVQARCKYRGDESIVVDYCKELDGYLWTFPKSNGLANVGAGYFKRRPKIRLRELVERYIEFIGAEPIYYIAAPLGVGLNRPFVRYVENVPVALVGDAAGMVDEHHGEGMTKAILAARILANCLKDGLEGLKNYERQFFKELGWYYRMARIFYYLRRTPFYFPVLRLIGRL